MFVSPVIEHELRKALRRHDPVKSRMRAALMAAAVSLVFLLFGLLTREWGSGLFHFLFLGCLYFVLIRPAQITFGIVSDERRNQTLELLFLTGMTSAEFFAGKVLGATLVASCELLAVGPLLAIPFISGGLSADLYLSTVVCLPTLLVFIISASVLASVLCHDDTMALLVTLAVVVMISGATPIPFFLGKLLTGRPPFSAAWLSISPAYGAIMVGSQFKLGSASAFWPTALCTWIWTLICFSFAAYYLARNWREDPDAGALRTVRARWQTLVRGTISWRSNLRSVVLARNPYQWLAQRDRRPVLAAWGSVLLLCALWLGGWMLWPQYWPSTMNFFITSMLLILALDMVVAQTAARRIGSDRRDAFLELLLTTPLSPSEMVEGQIAAIREEFQTVRRMVLVLFVLMMAAGFFTRTWSPQGIVTYVAVWAVLFYWCSRSGTGKVPLIMWIAANTGRPALAALRTGGGIGSWFWIIFQLRNLRSLKGLGTFPTGSTAECVIVVFVVVIIFIITAATGNDPSDMTLEFSRHLRSIAQEPVPDPQDPRYKRWKNVKERFPSS